MGRTINPPPGSIKSIQRGSFAVSAPATSGTATVAAVNVNKAVLFLSGQRTSGANGHFGGLDLTNSTTITATRALADTGVSTTFHWQLVEYY